MVLDGTKCQLAHSDDFVAIEILSGCGAFGTVEPLLGGSWSHSLMVQIPFAALDLSIGYLRAFLILLVVAHHAVLAYHPFAPAVITSLRAEPRWWQAFPFSPERPY